MFVVAWKNFRFGCGGIKQIRSGLSGFILCHRRDQPKRLRSSAALPGNLPQWAQLADYAWRTMK
jgi:hypothetical protein